MAPGACCAVCLVGYCAPPRLARAAFPHSAPADPVWIPP
ncbi:Hypothetical protein AA314_09692 [Archangium gephyra]|uniref:Uncharacterized protein n=1 Tax=Archangium gephyra TaxID=48 RepID=A0AAC8QIA3_9BACT|nr:Hypothetical protein AA314_09692 [Archangium gephyra]